MLRFTPALYSDPTNLVACKPTTKHLISHWPSFIGAHNSTRSSLNTTRRVYFYVIVKMWFKLPIYKDLNVRQREILRLRLRMTGLVILLTTLALAACSKLESFFIDEPIAAGIDSRDKDVTEYLQKMLQSARSMQKSGLVRGRLGMAYDVNGLRDAALVTYQQAESLDPDDFRWPYFRARLIAEYGEYEQALEILSRALAIDADYAPAWLLQGTWLLELGRTDAAGIAFDQAFNLEASAAATLGRARVMLARGQHQQATELLEPLAPATKHPYVYRKLGEALRVLGRTEAARDAMVRGKDAVAPSWPDERWDQRSAHIRGYASYEQVQQLSASGQVQEALVILERLQRYHPQEACGGEDEFFLACNLLNSISIAYDRSGFPSRALETVQQGLAINAEFIPFHFTIANLYGHQLDFEKALLHIERAIELNPSRGYAYEQKGRMLFGLTRYEAAKVAFETALRFQPEEPENLFYLGLTDVELKNWADAVQRFERVIRLDPGFALGHVFLARTLGEVGRLEEARRVQDDARRFGADPSELRVTEIRLRELEANR